MTSTIAPPPTAATRIAGRPTGPRVAAGLALGTCITVNLVDPNVDGALGWCPFKLATGGLDCPGCGVLRATRALTRGDVARALDHNVLWTLLVPLLAWGLLGWWRQERGSVPHRPSPSPAVLGALAVTASVFWVARNLPMLGWLGSGAA